MSTFNISNITLAGAYVQAVTAAKDSDHRSAGRRLETGEGSDLMKLPKTLVRRFAAITEERPAADCLSARPVWELDLQSKDHPPCSGRHLGWVWFVPAEYVPRLPFMATSRHEADRN